MAPHAESRHHALDLTVLTHAQAIAMFQRVGEITLTTEASIIGATDQLNWLHARVTTRDDQPCVYLWVEEAPGHAPSVLYVGKAGSTLARRCREHAQGFRSSDRGKAHAAVLWPKIRGGSRIFIDALWPDPMPFAGSMIPTHSSVEDWLIRSITPKPERNG